MRIRNITKNYINIQKMDALICSKYLDNEIVFMQIMLIIIVP